jgi:murein L,D-transpeptidase YcbB/YkuD
MWWLWMFVAAAGPEPMRIVINIPAFRLDVYVSDSIVRTMPIAPGMSRYKTPRASFAITSVQWNPWWIPPKSPWAAKEKPTPPGPGNPMGRVKLNFQPLYFLHGTPFRHSIGTAASHGCIRLKNEDAIELARLTLRFGMRTLTSDDIVALSADTVSTRTIELEEPVPIEIRYDLVEVRNGRVSVYRDVYHLSSKSLRAECTPRWPRVEWTRRQLIPNACGRSCGAFSRRAIPSSSTRSVAARRRGRWTLDPEST